MPEWRSMPSAPVILDDSGNRNTYLVITMVDGDSYATLVDEADAAEPDTEGADTIGIFRIYPNGTIRRYRKLQLTRLVPVEDQGEGS